MSKTRSFTSLEGKKSQICKLLVDILMNKYPILKKRKTEVSNYVKERLHGSVVSTELKNNIEAEAVELFSKPLKNEKPKPDIPKQKILHSNQEEDLERQS